MYVLSVSLSKGRDSADTDEIGADDGTARGGDTKIGGVKSPSIETDDGDLNRVLEGAEGAEGAGGASGCSDVTDTGVGEGLS